MDKCAACKHQRKNCDINCPLASYFPSNKAEEFQHVIRLFRVSNIIKMLNSVADNEKKAKMAETLISEAKIRYENPVHGCLAVERKLRLEIEETKKEFDLVQKKIAFYKELRERSSSHKENEEISISDTQSFQGYKYDSTMKEVTSINEHLTIQDVDSMIGPISTSTEPDNTRVEFKDDDEI